MKTHILLDIEALGRRPGSAIIELGAVEFFPDAGTLGRSFEAMIEPQAPFTADLDTLAWHAKKGTWPRPVAEGPVTGATHTIGSALVEFGDWLADGGEVEAFWAWGATYDFPLLTAAYDFTGTRQPWQYWQQRCARSAWQLAFGDRRHDPRPHRAVEDAKAAAVDLMEAIAKLTRKKNEKAQMLAQPNELMENDDYCDECPNVAGCYAMGKCAMPAEKEKADARRSAAVCSRIQITLEITDPEVVADYKDTCDELVWEDLVDGELINFAEFVSRKNAEVRHGAKDAELD